MRELFGLDEGDEEDGVVDGGDGIDGRKRGEWCCHGTFVFCWFAMTGQKYGANKVAK
jgi:hypothetical protein